MIDSDEKPHETRDEQDQAKKETREPDKYIEGNAQKLSKAMSNLDLSNTLSLFFSLCLVVASFLTFLAICVQALIYNSQLGEMKKSTEAATKAAQDTVTLVRDNARLEQRAWVAPIDAKGRPEAGKPYIVTVTFKNSGRTFAKNVQLVTVIQIGPSNAIVTDFDTLERSTKVVSSGLLAPDGICRGVPQTATISQEDINGLISGAVKAWVHGRMTYDDIFGNSHWVKFAYRVMPDFDFQAIETHNDAGDGPCP
jgi:hypothetical protein